MKMKIYADFTQEVTIDPLEVIEQLKDEFTHGSDNWISFADGKWFLMTEMSAGAHSYDESIKELTEKEMEYYNALVLVEKTLKRKKK